MKKKVEKNSCFCCCCCSWLASSGEGEQSPYEDSNERTPQSKLYPLDVHVSSLRSPHITQLIFKTHFTKTVVAVSIPSSKRPGAVGFGKRKWCEERRSLSQSPCFPHDLCRRFPSVPHLLCECHYLPGGPLLPLLVAYWSSFLYKPPISEAPSSRSFALLPWHTDCVLRASSLPRCAPLLAANHQYAPGFCSFASVKSWPSQLPEVELLPVPRDFAMQRSCACAIFSCLHFSPVPPLQDTFEGTSLLWFWIHWVVTSA